MHPASTRQAIGAISNVLKILNNGTEHDLSKLPGVGGKTVQQILALRQKGEIKLRDTMAMKGVGVGTLQKITQNTDVTIVVKICQYFQETFQDMLTKVLVSIKIDQNSMIKLIYFKKYFSFKKSPCHYPIMALDIGLSSIAMVNISSSLKVLDWYCIEFQPPRPYSPSNLFKEVTSLINTLPLSSSTVLLIEGQSHRRMGSPISTAGYMDISLRLRLIEGMLYGVARERGIQVYCISPKMVAKYFEINRNGRYYQKKQAATLVVSHLVGAGGLELTPTPLGNYLNISEPLVKHYWKQKKMDDLSDCLLQALSFHEWTELYKIW